MIRSVIAVCVTLSACAAFASLRASQEPTDHGPVDADSYAVYGAVLPDLWPVRVARATFLVLLQETRTNPTCEPSGVPIDDTWRDVLTDYRRENGEPHRVLPKRDVGIAYHRLQARESGGYISVSAVGFDESRTRAMVYVTHSCSSQCGGGGYHLLEKREGTWQEVRPVGVHTCRIIA
jgi:hypothetical protein